MNMLILLLIFTISTLFVLTPPFAVWRALARRASGPTAWLRPAVALIGLFLAAVVLIVLIWLPAYSGECGGWLGETSPCSGFSQYVTEALFWAAMSMAMPGVLGVLLGLAAVVVLFVRRRGAGSTV